MNVIQKIIVLVVLVVMAVMFHTFFCEWGKFESSYKAPEALISFGDFDDGDEVSMIYADHIIRGKNVVAMILGILFPFLIISFGVYLYFGWRDEVDKYISDIG